MVVTMVIEDRDAMPFCPGRASSLILLLLQATDETGRSCFVFELGASPAWHSTERPLQGIWCRPRAAVLGVHTVRGKPADLSIVEHRDVHGSLG